MHLLWFALKFKTLALVNLYADSLLLGGNTNVNFRVTSAPLSRTSSRQGKCPSTAREVKENTKPKKSDLHWMAWDTGNLEPPGLQKRCHRPWPSPEPPITYGEKGRITPSRPASRVASAPPRKEVTTPPSVPRAGSARSPDYTCGDSGVPCAVDQQKVRFQNLCLSNSFYLLLHCSMCESHINHKLLVSATWLNMLHYMYICSLGILFCFLMAVKSYINTEKIASTAQLAWLIYRQLHLFVCSMCKLITRYFVFL